MRKTPPKRLIEFSIEEQKYAAGSHRRTLLNATRAQIRALIDFSQIFICIELLACSFSHLLVRQRRKVIHEQYNGGSGSYKPAMDPVEPGLILSSFNIGLGYQW
jgi:hypothetical protein